MLTAIVLKSILTKLLIVLGVSLIAARLILLLIPLVQRGIEPLIQRRTAR